MDGESSTGYKIFENTIDALFFMDIIINFISAIENPDGSINSRMSVIVKTYVKSWFLLDIVATLPT